jgi:hypothetical protein
MLVFQLAENNLGAQVGYVNNGCGRISPMCESEQRADSHGSAETVHKPDNTRAYMSKGHAGRSSMRGSQQRADSQDAVAESIHEQDRTRVCRGGESVEPESIRENKSREGTQTQIGQRSNHVHADQEVESRKRKSGGNGLSAADFGAVTNISRTDTCENAVCEMRTDEKLEQKSIHGKGSERDSMHIRRDDLHVHVIRREEQTRVCKDPGNGDQDSMGTNRDGTDANGREEQAHVRRSSENGTQEITHSKKRLRSNFDVPPPGQHSACASSSREGGSSKSINGPSEGHRSPSRGRKWRSRSRERETGSSSRNSKWRSRSRERETGSSSRDSKWRSCSGEKKGASPSRDENQHSSSRDRKQQSYSGERHRGSRSRDRSGSSGHDCNRAGNRKEYRKDERDGSRGDPEDSGDRDCYNAGKNEAECKQDRGREDRSEAERKQDRGREDRSEAERKQDRGREDRSEAERKQDRGREDRSEAEHKQDRGRDGRNETELDQDRMSDYGYKSVLPHLVYNNPPITMLQQGHNRGMPGSESSLSDPLRPQQAHFVNISSGFVPGSESSMPYTLSCVTAMMPQQLYGIQISGLTPESETATSYAQSCSMQAMTQPSHLAHTSGVMPGSEFAMLAYPTCDNMLQCGNSAGMYTPSTSTVCTTWTYATETSEVATDSPKADLPLPRVGALWDKYRDGSSGDRFRLLKDTVKQIVIECCEDEFNA